jgi:hypothetical protein
MQDVIAQARNDHNEAVRHFFGIGRRDLSAKNNARREVARARAVLTALGGRV